MITYGSVCSGIEAASVAWHGLGFRASWFAEIEPFPSSVLAHRWPAVPNLGDMTKLAREVLLRIIAAPLILVGGTPCQDFSVAGMRAAEASLPRTATQDEVLRARIAALYACDVSKEAADECPDGPRYKAIGNSKAVPVVRWLGRRIQQQLERRA